MVLHMDVRIRRSAWMRERSDAREVDSTLATFRGGVHCAALSCFAQARVIHPLDARSAERSMLR
jgi:hypothetical protein